MEDDTTRYARKGYEAYVKCTGFDLPFWEDLPAHMQNGWRDVADAIVTAAASDGGWE